jgi:hypothetical protein
MVVAVRSCYKLVLLLRLKFERVKMDRCWWLTPIILATQEAEIGRIMVQSQPR